MTIGIRKTGDFCWMNMLTPQPAAAREFFSKLLGWTFVEWPGVGHGAQVDGRYIGGLFDSTGPNSPPGTKPVIGVMVKVASADATAKRVAALGGKAKPPFDIADQGRMAVCFDPNGAEFDIWEPRSMPGTDADSTLHGAPSWFETLTTDVERVIPFYTALFGWTPDPKPMPGFTYTAFKLGAEHVCGMMPILPHMGPMKPHWATYFTVKNADETARRTAELGATLIVPVMDIPGVGRFCGITSPQGVTIWVIEYTK